MNDLTVVEPINADIIRSRILTIRGVQVMLSSDLSDLYEVEVKHLHRQVKRNTGRFPSDFVIHLSPEEVKGLRCQNVTSKRGGFTAPVSAPARNRRFAGLLPDSNIIQRVEIAEKVGNAPVSLLADDTAPSRNA